MNIKTSSVVLALVNIVFVLAIIAITVSLHRATHDAIAASECQESISIMSKNAVCPTGTIAAIALDIRDRPYAVCMCPKNKRHGIFIQVPMTVTPLPRERLVMPKGGNHPQGTPM